MTVYDNLSASRHGRNETLLIPKKNLPENKHIIYSESTRIRLSVMVLARTVPNPVCKNASMKKPHSKDILTEIIINAA